MKIFLIGSGDDLDPIFLIAKICFHIKNNVSNSVYRSDCKGAESNEELDPCEGHWCFVWSTVTMNGRSASELPGIQDN